MSQPSVLVTGANGFVGQHLVRHLAAVGRSVVATARDDAPAPAISDVVDTYISCDLTKSEIEVDVGAVVHLAGLSAVGPSFESPQQYLSANTAMTTNLLEPLVRRAASPRVLVVSTGAVYGAAQQMPISESGLVSPASPYAVSKLAVENQANYYFNRGVDIVVARPFNHIGPGQASGFIVPDLISKILLARETGEPITTGDLSSFRDYTDVRDVVAAYAAMLEIRSLDSFSIVNVCSGTSTSGEAILAHLLEIANVDRGEVAVVAANRRPTDPSRICGDNRALRSSTGWSSTIPLAASLRDSWEHATQ